MPQAGAIYSNLKRSNLSYDEELPTPVVTDSLPYTDVSSQEMIDAEQEAFELAYAGAAGRRWQGQERWQGRENEEMRVVNILHPHAIFRRLQRAGVDARIEAPSYYVWDVDHKTGKPIAVKQERTEGRMWLHDFVVQGRVGISAWVYQKNIGKRVRKCVTSLQYPVGPEWSVLRFDEYNVPTVEKYRGWRTALLMLMMEDVITEEEVNRAFPLVLNPASDFYRLQVQEIRRRRQGAIL